MSRSAPIPHIDAPKAPPKPKPVDLRLRISGAQFSATVARLKREGRKVFAMDVEVRKVNGQRTYCLTVSD